MSKTKLILTSVLSASMLLGVSNVQAADEKPDVSKLPPAVNIPGVTYENHIKPILEKSCVECHSGRRPKSRYDMQTLEGIIKGGSSDEAAVVPGKSAESPLVWYIADLVEEMEMPPLDKREDYPVLKKEQIALIRAWIDQGAK